MTLSELLGNAEFWAALFGALAAFLLGAMGQWWAASRAKATAGNLAMITLAQMYALLENLRFQLFIEEASRAALELGCVEPPSIFLRPVIGLPRQELRLEVEELGFLADSHDPDILNRLLTIERQFASMVDLVRRHHELHAEFQERMSRFDPTGLRQITIQDLPQMVGGPLLHQLDDAVDALAKGLPETRDHILKVADQLLLTLRMQLPARRFISFKGSPRSEVPDAPSDLSKPALWRKAVRTAVDFLVKRRTLLRQKKPVESQAPNPAGPRVRRVMKAYAASERSVDATRD